MSDQMPSAAFPQRTPVFTAVVVIVAALAFSWVVHRYYHPSVPVAPRGNANPADFAADVRWKMTPEGRAQRLTELRAREQAESTTYGWVDQKAGIVRLPLDRAVELTVRDLSRK